MAFDTNVYVYDPYVDDKTIKELGGKKVTNIMDGLKIADYVSLHMPLTNETKDLINYPVLKEMKTNAVIVNTARGGIINEIDLDKALNENLIFGAGLDVFTEEPINKDNPLLDNKKVILSPHSALLLQMNVLQEWELKLLKILLIFLKIKLIKSMIVKL